MKIALIIVLGIIVLGVVAYCLFFPRNLHLSFYRPSGGALTFSRTGVSLEAPPDHYATDGFSHIESYVSRLLIPSKRFKSIGIFTPDGNHGFGLNAQDGKVEASLTVEWRQEAEREAAIRGFFSSLGIAPSRDYLAGNGGVPDATRYFSYPIIGSATEVTALTKRILQELCTVSPRDALDISYREK